MMIEKGECIVLVCIVGLAAFSAGLGVAIWGNHLEAVDAGVAEWRVNPKTGSCEFVWLPCKEGDTADFR